MEAPNLISLPLTLAGARRIERDRGDGQGRGGGGGGEGGGAAEGDGGTGGREGKIRGGEDSVHLQNFLPLLDPFPPLSRTDRLQRCQNTRDEWPFRIPFVVNPEPHRRNESLVCLSV